MEYQTLSPNIGVKSVDETVQFYTETLGFNLIMSVPAPTGGLQWAMVANGGATLMFQEMGNLTEEYPQLAGRPVLGAITFYVKMKGMQTLYEKLQGTESIAKEMHQTFYGADEFAIFDNNGHILTITEDAVEPTAIKNYDNYFLPANNYQESVHFYSEVLGLEKKFEFAEQGMVAFKVGNEEPAIILKDKTKMPNTIPAIWIEVEDTKAVYEKMKAKGIVFLSEPFKIRTGWAVELNDPSGNRLGFTDYKRD
ncbi:VOC family protein [Bacteroides sp. 214]|uniref:VOC family protein n=1 Tax=Bacteroides sp. 214 TaxID=2302935 RepID=UPI001EF37295|nr:VOC family protein [Bacteroides sp. 214]